MNLLEKRFFVSSFPADRALQDELPVFWEAGNSPEGIAFGNFTADQLPDLAVANFEINRQADRKLSSKTDRRVWPACRAW